MKNNFIAYINGLEKKTALFLILLFAASFTARFPTLFNDYYDADELAAIVQTHEYMAGDIPGKDFAESKLPVYHAIFKISYTLSKDYGWVIVHFAIIMIVFFTALFIFLLGNLLYDFKTGAIGALLYAILISSFNRHFMATNGEIVYNLPLIAALYFFILFLKNKNMRFVCFLTAIAMGVCACGVKFHGIIFFIFLLFFFVFYKPYFEKRLNKKYILIISICTVAILSAILFDYFISQKFVPVVLAEIKAKLFYAAIKGTNPLIFLAKFVHRQGMLAVWHFALWFSAFFYISKFIKNKFRADTLAESSAAIFLIAVYLLIFAGGSRLYFHYFMATYPALCLFAAIAINTLHSDRIKSLKDNLGVYILIPFLFFWLWNMKDIAIKHLYPAAFYNEGKILYWARAALVGTFNDYLLPDNSYKDACEYIKSITKPEDRIFVWGDGPFIYYFSERRIGTYHMWPKTNIEYISRAYDDGNTDSAVASENGITSVIESKKPVLFIDTSENGLSTFNYKLTPVVKAYVSNNYYFLKEINKIKIYHIRNMPK